MRTHKAHTNNDDMYPQRVSRFRAAAARWRARYRTWVDESMPTDDDGPDGLPGWLRGTRGRIILGIAAIGVLGMWSWLLMSIF